MDEPRGRLTKDGIRIYEAADFTGMRRFRRALIELARGNGKTPFLAALALLFFVFDWPIEPRARSCSAGLFITRAWPTSFRRRR